MSLGDEPTKLIVVGDSSVGKTNLISQYISHEFSDDTQSTIGVEFQSKVVQVDGRDMRVSIWDTAGQERFRAISRSIYHGAKGVIIVYDITNAASFENITNWLEEVRSLIPPQAPIMLVGNKTDLDHARVVKKDVADAFARQQNLLLFETSAKDRTNVDRAFDQLVKLVHEAMVQAAAQGRTIGRPTPQRALPGRQAPPGASVDLSSGANASNRPPGADGQDQNTPAEEGGCGKC